MANCVIIASDSTTDLPAGLIEKYQIKILPLGITLGDRLYTDGVDINPDMIYAHFHATGELPKTSAVNTAQCHEFFSSHTADGSSMVFFTISAEMSSTYANALLAAKGFDNVFVVDTRSLSTGGGLIVTAAARMAQRGMEAGEIARACAELTDNVHASFVVDDLTFLYKGGRCSAVAAIGANLVQIKPCIALSGGRMWVSKKYRGSFAAVLKKYTAELIEEARGIGDGPIFINHAGCDEAIVAQCTAQVSEAFPEAEIIHTRAGCTISSHCGKNTLGIMFIKM